MLHRVLEELESAQGLADLDGLSRRLGIERGALEGMIDFWVRKGRLQGGARDRGANAAFLGGDVCGACPGQRDCPLCVNGPRRKCGSSNEYGTHPSS